MGQGRWFWISTIAAAVALLFALLELSRTPLPWFDEILLVSAARSAASGHPAVPSVLNSFPHTMRSDLFYGPVVFWIGSATIKSFGLSLWSWRLLGWLSGVAFVLESAWLVLRLGGSGTYAAIAALLVTLSPAMGSTLTSGRTDTITLALELSAVCLLVPTASLVRSILAGLLFGAAILSTPRAHPFALSFFLVSFGYPIIRKHGLLLRNVSLAGTTALLTVTAWTFYAGLNPVSWYLMLLRASKGDKTNVSPLLGGSWGNFSLDLNSSILLVGLIAWFISWAIHKREKRPLGLTGVMLIIFVANAALFLVLVSRALSYRIFWLVPLVPVIVAVTSIYAVGQNSKRSGMAYVLMATILIAGLSRVGKVTQVIASWTARDPLPLKSFVCAQVPQNSKVFGPADLYYYAVEECGSHYLFAGQWTARGLRSPLDPSEPVYRSGDFLLWPADAPLPRVGELKEIASFRPKNIAEPLPQSALTKLIKREFPFTGGYPQSILYQVKRSIRPPPNRALPPSELRLATHLCTNDGWIAWLTTGGTKTSPSPQRLLDAHGFPSYDFENKSRPGKASMQSQDHAISYLSASTPVSMGDWWFDVANTDHFWITRRFQVLAKLAHAAILNAHHAAEIGCGNGLLQKKIEDHYDKPVTGFDLNELALRKNLSRISPLYCYDIHQRNPEFCNRFDLLFLFDVLEHIENESAFLQSVKFHLAPSGILVINVPALQGLFSDYDRAAGHVRRYSIKQLANVSEQNGFKVRAVTYWGLPLLPLLVVRKAMKLSRDNGRGGFDSRGAVLNFALSLLSRCELVPQRLVGTSVMAVLEKT